MEERLLEPCPTAKYYLADVPIRKWQFLPREMPLDEYSFIPYSGFLNNVNARRVGKSAERNFIVYGTFPLRCTFREDLGIPRP